MGVFLFFGLAFERGRDGFESGPVFGFEDVPERSFGAAVAVLQYLGETVGHDSAQPRKARA